MGYFIACTKYQGTIRAIYFIRHANDAIGYARRRRTPLTNNIRLRFITIQCPNHCCAKVLCSIVEGIPPTVSYRSTRLDVIIPNGRC